MIVLVFKQHVECGEASVDPRQVLLKVDLFLLVHVTENGLDPDLVTEAIAHHNNLHKHSTSFLKTMI